MTMRALCLAAVLAALLCAPALALDSIDALLPAPTDVKITTGYAPKDGKVTVKVDESRADIGEDGYILVCDRGGYQITAQTDAGAYYGKLTLGQMKGLGSIPVCTVTDKPVMKMRGVMLDMARLTEKHEYYYYIIDQLAQWKIDTVFLHLTDDQGCAVEFKKHPGLATPHAFTQSEMKDMVKYAAERKIELIPEIESWGHAGYITRLPEFSGLSEGGGGDLCTCNPKTWELLNDLYKETVTMFPGRYIHAGCDEASYGVCSLCKGKSKEKIAAEHMMKVAELVKANGKIPMMWGDVLLTNRAAADSLPKYTIVCDWHYDRQVKPESVQFLKGAGFEVVGCPSLVFGSRMIIPGPDALDNVQSFSKVVLDSNCLGLENTLWYPQRYIPNTINFGLAYGAELSWAGEKRDRTEFAKAFTRSYFGFTATTEFAQVLWNASDLMMKPHIIAENLWNSEADLDKLTREATKTKMTEREKAKATLNGLQRYRKNVKSHEDEYDALVLAAEAVTHIGNRGVGGYMLTYHLGEAENQLKTGEKAAAAKHVQEAVELIADLIKQEAEIRTKLDAAWGRWRYADDPQKRTGGQSFFALFTNSDTYMKAILPRLKTAKGKVDSGEAVDWDAITAEPAK